MLKKEHTVLFSTVLKPTSDILGSFSPSSKADSTLVASENIPRSVRTRTCNEIEKHMNTVFTQEVQLITENVGRLK